ncbi:hypothetical protein EES39_37255 [Streptomyces sp. ADI92-24]|nr:hypothetical protein EDD95_6206 [Streptomyces sp. CEV 2-1]RPK33385.1 hypothetical protein EES39_37255 [Streptomyces sp. ADI92-24]
MNHRHLVRDYGAHAHRSEAGICLATISPITHGLAAESTRTPTYAAWKPCAARQSRMRKQGETPFETLRALA